MKHLRWLLFIPFVLLFTIVESLRIVIVLFCRWLAWVLKWVLAGVILAKHGVIAMDAYLEGVR